jgi:DNA-binding transcriptional MerR regulator/methylmalonyl-CoA mutase cobalamin-binding subunit
MYSIKAIASLTGLGAETLRAWERRYQAIVPKRNASGRRFYSQQDLERLNLLADLTRQGHSIGKISGLSDKDLRLLLNSVETKPDEQKQFNQKIIDALLDYRIDRCEQLLKRALMANEPLAYVVDILTPLLKQVGELWHDKKINVAQEHMFSACVQRILLGMVNGLHTVSANRPAMLFATPTAEPHEFGILMSCLLAAEQQYNCYYLGANVPAEDIVDAARKLKCDVIVLSLMQFPPETNTLAELSHIVAEAKAEVWMGGSGAHYWAEQRTSLEENCEILKDINDFYVKAQRRRYSGQR